MLLWYFKFIPIFIGPADLWKHKNVNRLLHAFGEQISNFACVFYTSPFVLARIHTMGIWFTHVLRQKYFELLQCSFGIDFGALQLWTEN